MEAALIALAAIPAALIVIIAIPLAILASPRSSFATPV
jgi:hypothetical protein